MKAKIVQYCVQLDVVFWVQPDDMIWYLKLLFVKH